MAEDSEQEQSPRLDQSRIIAIGLILVTLSSVFAMTTTASSPLTSCTATPPSPCWTQVQHQTSTCTITPPATSCTVTITFSPAYSGTPQFYADFNDSTIFPSGVVTSPEQFTIRFPIDNATWKNMNSHDAFVEFNNSATQEFALFNVAQNQLYTANGIEYMSVPSTNATATINFQYEVFSNPGVWTTVAVLLPASVPGWDFGNGGNVQFTLANGNSFYIFRVIGADGGGAGDNPIFGSIQLSLQYSQQIGSVTAGCLPGQSAISATSVTIKVQCRSVFGAAFSPKVDWWTGIAA